MNNFVVSNFLSNVVKKEWVENNQRIGYTQELIVEVKEDLYEHAKKIKEAWDEVEVVYMKMSNNLTKEQWKELFGKKIFFINAIKVEKDKRGRGYGTKMIENLEESAKSVGAEELHLVLEELDEEYKTEKEEKENIKRIQKWFKNLGYEFIDEKNKLYLRKRQL